MKTMPVASEPKRALVMQQFFQHLARGFVGTDRFFGTHRHMSVAKANSFPSPHGESVNHSFLSFNNILVYENNTMCINFVDKIFVANYAVVSIATISPLNECINEARMDMRWPRT